MLHRRLVAAEAQSFLITPIALNGARKTDKLDARGLCLRVSRWLDGSRDEFAPIRIPTEPPIAAVIRHARHSGRCVWAHQSG